MAVNFQYGSAAGFRFAWTDERVVELKRLVTEGLSAGQIAAAIGGITRNAVIGKVLRLGLKLARGHGQNRRPTAEEREQRRLQRLEERKMARRVPIDQRKKRGRPFQSYLEATPEPEFSADELASGVTFIDLPHRACRWPIGDPSSLDTIRFCGQAPHPEKPYCTRHCRMAYQVMRDRA